MFRLFFSFLIFSLPSLQLSAQQYGVEKDKRWEDSVLKIVKKGFEYDIEQKNNWKKQVKYFDACISLGKYYEKLYLNGEVGSMKRSVYYYSLVGDEGKFVDDERYFKALALRNMVCRKLATIFFKGKGIKKDRALSIKYALTGMNNNEELFRYYSKRYYGRVCIFIKEVKNEYTNDSTLMFTVNPFALKAEKNTRSFQDCVKKDRLWQKYLTTNEQKFEKISILFYAEASMRSQVYGIGLLNRLKEHIISRNVISENNILTDLTIDYETNVITISGEQKRL